MEDEIKQVISIEIKKHKFKMANHHIDEITNNIFAELIQHVSLQQLYDLVHHMQDELADIIDSLIPVVTEYETRVEDAIDTHLNNLVKK